MKRRVRITNCYERYPTAVVELDVEVDPYDGGSVKDYFAYLQDELFQYTGVGHEDGNSYYEVVSIDGLSPEIVLEWG